MSERSPGPPSLAARLLGRGGRGAQAVAVATGIDDALDRATEEAIVRALESEAVQRAFVRVLERAVEEGRLSDVLANPALERALTDALDSELVDRLWERILESDEAQKLVERIAEAPEVRSAVAMQGVGLIEDLAGQIGWVADRLDYVIESVVRALLRRPPRSQPTNRAGLVSRGLALACDFGILNLGLIAITALVALGATAAFPESDRASTEAIVLWAGAWTLGIGAYLVFFWTLAGQTPGMRLLRIRLQSDDGARRLGFRQAVRRLVGIGLSIAAFGLGLLAVLVSDRRLGWHDRIARTEVVDDERRLTASWFESADAPA